MLDPAKVPVELTSVRFLRTVLLGVLNLTGRPNLRMRRGLTRCDVMGCNLRRASHMSTCARRFSICAEVAFSLQEDLACPCGQVLPSYPKHHDDRGLSTTGVALTSAASLDLALCKTLSSARFAASVVDLPSSDRSHLSSSSTITLRLWCSTPATVITRSVVDPTAAWPVTWS